MTRVVGQNAAIQAAIRQHYFQPVPRSQIISPPIPPFVVIPVALMVEGEPGWHLPGDHDDPVALATEGVVIGLFLVVVVIGFWTTIRYARRTLPTDRSGRDLATENP